MTNILINWSRPVLWSEKQILTPSFVKPVLPPDHRDKAGKLLEKQSHVRGGKDSDTREEMISRIPSIEGGLGF